VSWLSGRKVDVQSIESSAGDGQTLEVRECGSWLLATTLSVFPTESVPDSAVSPWSPVAMCFRFVLSAS